MLPFLNDKKWPISKEPEVRVANPSHDTQLQDHLIDEILVAIEKKDHPKLSESLRALIENILSEDQDDEM